MTDVVVLQIGTFLTVIAGFAYQAFRESRQRKWDVEDRRLLAINVSDAAKKAESHVLDAACEIHDAIKVNTEISTKAFHEANSVNLKIEKLGLEHNKLQRDSQDKD